ASAVHKAGGRDSTQLSHDSAEFVTETAWLPGRASRVRLRPRVPRRGGPRLEHHVARSVTGEGRGRRAPGVQGVTYGVLGESKEEMRDRPCRVTSSCARNASSRSS